MNEKCITFYVDGRKFITKLVSDVKPLNKVYYYTISELEDIIDLTLIENDITEAIEDNDEGNSILIESENSNKSSESKIEQIFKHLKDKFLNNTIALYKAKYR